MSERFKKAIGTRLRQAREAALAEGEEIRAARYQVQKELQEEIRALARRIEPAEAAAASDLPALIEEMIPIAAGMAAEWPNFPGPLKQALVRAFIQKVPVQLGESRHGVRRPFRVLPVVWQPWAGEDEEC